MSFVIGTPHTRGAGYCRNDDTPSGGKLSEADIQSCPHCQAVIKMQEWRTAKVQNFCNRCMAPTCDSPGCVHECVPFMQVFEQWIGSNEKYVSYLKQAGLEPVSPPPQLILPG